MKFAIFIVVVCFSAQALARPRPDDVVQEFLESIKLRVSDALNQVQDIASRAIESAKTAVLNGLQTAQNSAKQGIEVGQSFVKFGENTARKFIEDTSKSFSRPDNSLEQNNSSEIQSGEIQTEQDPQNRKGVFPPPNLPFGEQPSETINFT